MHVRTRISRTDRIERPAPAGAARDRRVAGNRRGAGNRRVAGGRRGSGVRKVAGIAAAGAAVALLAACGSDDEAGGDLPPVEGPTSPRLEVTASEMSYDPSAVAVAAGEVEVVLHNAGNTLHDIRIEDQPVALEANPGDTATDQVSLEAGRYQYFCSLPGHRDAGMEGVLEVREP